MSQSSPRLSLSSPSLPGPVTSPNAHISNIPNTSIPLQSLSPTSTVTASTVSSQAKRNKAWKYEGYKDFSSWMASEDDFFLFRRFENLNAQTILWMQDRISQIEERLEEIHNHVADSHPDDKLRNDSLRWDKKYMPERHELMVELSGLLHHFNQYIEAFAKVHTRSRAEDRQITNVENWLQRGAIAGDERSFINHTGDLISISSRKPPPIGRWFEAFHLNRLFRAKTIPDRHVSSAATAYYSNSKFEYLTNTSIIGIGLCMLLGPLWWLEFVNRSVFKLGIITGFICLFILMMSAATVNNPFEVVAATAAYAAVLMVFMQISASS